MPRYIDADKLLRDTIYNPNHVPYIAESDIIFAPKVDAVEVVRCKDCKWFGDIGCAIRIVDESDKPKETDFCSFGERREDE